MNFDNFLETLWDALLSREPDRVRSAFTALDPDSQRAVLDHLKRMAEEAGWHPDQSLSARIALAAISNNPV